MIRTPFSILFAGFAATLLAACAGADDRYPSLAVRDAERVQGTLTPSPDAGPDAGTQVIALTPSGSSQTEAILAASAKANDLSVLFDLDEENVRGLVAASRGQGPDSDARARALVGVAGLISLRGQTAIALADLDQMEARAATSFAQASEIRAAQSQVASLLDRQDAALDSLNAELAQ